MIPRRRILLVTGLSICAAAVLGAACYTRNDGAIGTGSPAPAAAGQKSERAAVVRVKLDADKSYYVAAGVNGVPVRFLVDTGATITVLRKQDALKAGFALRPSDFSDSVQGIDGAASVANVTIKTLSLGEIVIHDLEADVDQSTLDVSLLGQNFLARIERLVIEDGIMTLQGKETGAAVRMAAE